MRLKATATILIGTAICICSCTGQNKNAIAKVKWLIGTWENQNEQGAIIYESWTRVNDTKLYGKNFQLNGKDTILLETIELLQERDTVFYVPTVKGQNNNKPIYFALKSISDSTMEFENLRHDFPQAIFYRQIHLDSIVAEISGIKDGVEQKYTFPMSRVKGSH